MTKFKSTKRALLASGLALIMCISMLIGSTFAWFTDSVTSAGNTIQSGTLKVDLVDADGKSMEGQVIEFVAEDGRAQNEILWEPGCKYETEPVYVVNKGNLALKYQIVINGITGNAKLLEAIDWTVTIGEDENNVDLSAFEGKLYPEEGKDKSGAIVLTGHMKETAGNEYQGLTVDGISIAVFATQLTSESDSFGDQYDAMATYLNQDAEGNWLISSAGDMLYLAQQVNSGKSYLGETILLTNNVDLKNMKWTPIGNTSKGFMGTFDGQGKTISNYTVETDINAGLFGYALNGGNIKNLTVKNATVKADDYAGAILGRGYTDVVNCHAENVSVTVTPYLKANGITYDGGAKAGGIVGQLLEGAGNTVVDCSVKNVTITGYRDLGGVLGMAHNNNSVSGCSATNVTINYVSVDGVYDDGKTPNQNAGAIVGRIQSSATVDFTDAENKNFELTRFVASVAALATALENGENVVLTSDVKLENEALAVAAGQEVVIDLNGKTLSTVNTEAKASAAINNKGTLTLKNGTVTYKGVGDPNFGYGTNTIHNTGKLVIDGATIINTTDSGSSVAIDCAAGAELIVNSGVIKSVKNAIRLCPFGSAAISCTINGGEITGTRAIQIQLPSNKPADAPEINLTISGGKFNSTSGLAIYSFSAGQSFDNVNVSISGGTFNGDVAFGGGSAKTTTEKVTITGGTFNGALGRYIENDVWADIAKP